MFMNRLSCLVTQPFIPTKTESRHIIRNPNTTSYTHDMNDNQVNKMVGGDQDKHTWSVQASKEHGNTF
jgi:hypothetical protein